MTMAYSPNPVRRHFLQIAGFGAIALAAATVMPTGAKADKVYQSTFGGVAINGYDPVAYFTDGKPVDGSDDFTHDWNGATWRFASAEHRDMFAADPKKFAPQYGGYCAWAVSQGDTASTDPTAWTVVDGKLYLNYSVGVQRRWEKDIPGNIAKADKNWPGLEKDL